MLISFCHLIQIIRTKDDPEVGENLLPLDYH